MRTVAVQTKPHQIARPLKVLIPLIQSELRQGDVAGLEHYRKAGELLIEVKESEQVPYGSWGRWLSKNFELSDRTARQYMRLAREHRQFGAAGSELPYTSLSQMRGETERARERRAADQQWEARPKFGGFQRALRDIHADTFVQERQRVEEEIALHRKLAEELIDLGYRALATKLHPDRGGSKDAMARLNRVRDELKGIAQTRRFV